MHFHYKDTWVEILMGNAKHINFDPSMELHPLLSMG